MKLLEETIDLLLNEQPLEKRYCDHGLVGNYSGFRECHRNQQNAPPFLENKIETCDVRWRGFMFMKMKLNAQLLCVLSCQLCNSMIFPSGSVA